MWDAYIKLFMVDEEMYEQNIESLWLPKKA